MHTAEKRITTDDGVNLSVTVYTTTPEDAGNSAEPLAGRDILLLHGWPNDGTIWHSLAEALLTASRYRLVTMDFRGFGRSDPAKGGYTCEQFARDAVAVAKALGLTKDWALIGHSMGGKIAQVAASLPPPGLSALALLAPAPLVVASPTPDERKTAQRAAYGDRAKTRELVASMAAHPLSDDRLNDLTEAGLRAAPQAWNGWIDPMRDEDLSGRLAEIAVPTLVLRGAKDPQRTEEQLRRDVVERIAGATFETLPGVGHLPHVEDPETLAVALVNFLDLPDKGTAVATGVTPE